MEIGSEFWSVECATGGYHAGQTYLSGRTAMTAVLMDLRSRGIRSVGIPDYCCESMIEPFLRQEMQASFYPVVPCDGGLRFELERVSGCEAVLLVDYFGYMPEQLPEYADYCHKNGQLVLLDRTHGLFSSCNDTYYDYVFGSFRKWTGLEAGIAYRTDGKGLPQWPLTEAGAKYLELRQTARACKSEFVDSCYSSELLRHKQLALFGDAEVLLDEDYISGTDEDNLRHLNLLDVAGICRQRRANVIIVYDFLKSIKKAKPVFSSLCSNAVPLAVPVLLQEGERDVLRSYLRERGIFCPVHWPLSKIHQVGPGAMELYNNELTLVCDQRYTEQDIIQMMEIILEWEKT